MPYLVFTDRGLNAALSRRQSAAEAIWCGSDLLTTDQNAELSHDGLNLTRFIFPLVNATSQLIERVTETIDEHHPGEPIWIENTEHEFVEYRAPAA